MVPAARGNSAPRPPPKVNSRKLADPSFSSGRAEGFMYLQVQFKSVFAPNRSTGLS